MSDKYLKLNAGQLEEVEATSTSAGVANAGDIPALDASGLLDSSMIPTIDHGSLSGLGDDDHTQYHTDARAKTWVESGAIDFIYFNTSFVPSSHVEGYLHWNDDEGTLEIGMPGGNVALQVGQELLVRVRNTTGSQIDNGSVIKNIGSQGNKPLIALASALSSETPAQLGMATEDIGHNSNGYVSLIGTVRELDTSAWAEGTSLYLSTTAGEMTSTPPSAPDHVAWVGVVTRQHATEGSVYFKPTMPMFMSDLSDVNGTTPDATNKHLVWDNANGYWDAGQINHHDLLGLLDTDDHPQYVEKNGWDISYKDNVTLSFDDGTLTFSIAPTGASFNYWSNGANYVKTTTQSVTITDTEGLWFIKFTDDTLVASQTPWDIISDNDALTAVVYWDATNNTAIIVGYELHTWAMDPATHAYNHLTDGSRYGDGFTPGDLDIDGDGDDATSAQMSIAGGSFWDEDIHHEYVDGTPQDLSPIAQIPVFYRQGSAGEWRKAAATNTPFYGADGSNLAYWNENTTGTTWALTRMSNNDYYNVHIFASNDVDEPVFAVMGQAEYGTVGQARDGAEVELQELQFGGLDALTPEFIPIATFIAQASNGYDFATNPARVRFRATDTGDDYVDWRGITASGSGGTGGTSSDHGALSGLTDDDHTQYFNETRGDLRYLQILNDLSDLNSASTARTNLGLGSAALDDTGDFAAASHNHIVSDITDWATATLGVAGVVASSNITADNGSSQGSVILDASANGFKFDIQNIAGGWARGLGFYDDTSLLGAFYGFGGVGTITRMGIAALYSATDGLHVDMSNGYVGIGDPSPSYHLDVGGNANVTGTMYINNINVSGTVTGISASDVDAISTGTAAFTTPFIETTTPPTTSMVAVESAAGSMRWAELGNLPISDATQTALDEKGADTKIASIYIEDPTATDEWPLKKIPATATITAIAHKTDTGTVTFNIEKRTASTPETTGTEVAASDITATTTYAILASFSSAGLTANQRMYFVASAVASSPTKIWVDVSYKEA